MLILCLASHWLACIWGLTGYLVGAELCDEHGAPVLFDEAEHGDQDMSWMVALVVAGKTSPDSLCNAWEVYVVALYWSVMTITTTGYGDINPTRHSEYIICTVSMLAGGVLWAYVIGVTCSIVAYANPVQAHFENATDLLNRVLDEAGVEKSRRQVFREYLREAKLHKAATHFRDVANCFSPHLKGELLLHVTSKWHERVWYLKGAPEHFIMALCDKMQVLFFAKHERVQEYQDDLCLIERGSLVCDGIILAPGMHFRSDFIVSDRKFRRHQVPFALTYCMIGVLGRDSFFQAVAMYPVLAKMVRMAACKVAFARATVLCAIIAKARVPTLLSLASAFACLANDDTVYGSNEAIAQLWKGGSVSLISSARLRTGKGCGLDDSAADVQGDPSPCSDLSTRASPSAAGSTPWDPTEYSNCSPDASPIPDVPQNLAALAGSSYAQASPQRLSDPRCPVQGGFEMRVEAALQQHRCEVKDMVRSVEYRMDNVDRKLQELCAYLIGPDHVRITHGL